MKSIILQLSLFVITIASYGQNQLNVDLVVMAGERDMNAPLATVIAAYQIIPDSQLSIIPNAPHPVFLVNFPAVWAFIVPFLKQ